MRVIYPAGKDALLRGQIDLMVDSIKAQLVGAYTYNDADADATDLTGLVGPAIPVSVTDVNNGTALCADLVFNNLSGAPVTGIVFYKDMEMLLAYTNQRADTTPINVTPTGVDVAFSFDFLIRI